jgi:microsomal dipeptidase-like Zn-dependent dipeptidase
MNRLQMLLDLSHASPRTIADGIAASTAPMAITHTGCRALVNVPRNTSDSSLKALADRGGVAGIYSATILPGCLQRSGNREARPWAPEILALTSDTQFENYTRSIGLPFHTG